MIELTRQEIESGGRVVIYAHRTMLREQLVRNFAEAGIPCGELAAGADPDLSKPVQLASIQTVHQRCFKTKRWTLPEATLVLKDEAHQQAASRSREVVFGAIEAEGIIQGHKQRGADVLGMTATPLMKKGLYQKIIEFGTYSELRSQGMHLPVRVVSGDEIDCSGIKPNASGEYSDKEMEKRAPVIFGSAYDEWKRWNPDALPALLFAPSVPCSRWFALEWAKKGVMTAHIDGKSILLPRRTSTGGVELEEFPADLEMRDELLARSQSGEISVVMNRFVLREAIDMPWLYHAIFATVMGGLTTFLQSVGRIQRYHTEYDHKLLQCHGGSWWRHGSPNEDRRWELGMTNASMQRVREYKVGAGDIEEGIRCELCGAVRRSGDTCWNCQQKRTTSVRAVRQVDGTLKKMTGKVAKQRSRSTGKSAGDLWRTVWFASGYKDRSIKQAIANWKHKCRNEGITADQSQINPPLPKPGSYEYENLSMQQQYPKLIEIVNKRGKK